MKNFKAKAKLKHDRGTVVLNFVVCTFDGKYETAAAQAVSMLTKAENCPESAIVSITLTPMK